MAYPSPNPVGSAASLVFLLAAQSGLIVQSFSRKVGTKTVDIYDGSVGYTTGFFEHDINAMYDCKGYVAINGIPANATPGVILTLADVTSGNGVTSGGIYTKNTSLDHAAEQPEEFTVTARQLPGIN